MAGRPQVLRGDWQEPAADRFSPDEPGFERAMEAHRRAMVEGQQGYLDPSTGYFVMTAGYLASRPVLWPGLSALPVVALRRVAGGLISSRPADAGGVNSRAS